MRPTFLVIGAAKAGTTSFCELLAQHPGVFFSAQKELHYFSFDEVFARGNDWYEAHFSAAAPHQQVGEGSTTYTLRRIFPRVAERVAAYRPDIRLIYLVREPIARIESTWLQLRHFLTASPFQRVGVTGIPLAMCVSESFDESLESCADCLIESTDYGAELAEFRRHLPARQMLVLRFEDLASRPQETMRRAFEFLGADSDIVLPDYAIHRNESAARRLPRGVLWRAWASPTRRRLYDALVGVLPQRLRDSFRGLLTTPVERPQWRPETLARVRARLDLPLAEFLAQHGYPRDDWRGGVSSVTRR